MNYQWAAFCLSLALIGCGGGGGGGAAPPPTPPVVTATPTGLVATAKDGYVLLTANPVAGATAYNVYWRTTPGVSKANGTLLLATSNPLAHTGLTNGTAYYYVVTAVGANGESAPSAEVSTTPVAGAVAADPLFADQWNLKNTSQVGATNVAAKAGEDINVALAWQPAAGVGVTGQGVTVAVVDDGMEAGHEDLASNVVANGLSHNYVNGSSDPTNDPADAASGHGTSVAGIIAAKRNNGLGGVGVAPNAKVSGYNLLQSSLTANEADAMTRNAAGVSISSNSWGAPDGTGNLAASSFAWRNAIQTGLTTGRAGKGTVYVWAAGNGAQGKAASCTQVASCADNSNYDGQANYRGVMAVGAVNDQGTRSSYSEMGANLWVAAPGGEFCNTHAITTIDRTGVVGHNTTATDYANKNYTKCMNGTSSATPTVSGVVALMLEANPALSWRDVRVILAQTSRSNDFGVCTTVVAAGTPCPATTTGWWLNGTGVSSATNPRYYFNHQYGFGVVDAAAAVAAAKTWVNLPAELTFIPTPAAPNLAIPDYVAPTLAVPNPPSNAGVSHTLAVAGSGIASIEFVEITFSAANHTYAGDLDITLTSPSGSVSHLAVPHGCAPGGAGSCTPYNAWVFGSAAHLGELANGNWTITVKDSFAGDIGNLQSWSLKFYGH
ncbi:MAG: S8 family serine peptidase [Sideroxydans sp.]|nr:S8 family serine peptidase [Sideroxydans sp.]